MNNVVDMFSRKMMGVGAQDTEANDKNAVEGGVFVGRIDTELAMMVKQSGINVDDRARQIDAIVEKWATMAEEYYQMVEHVFEILDVEGFDEETQAIQIGEAGQVWVVPRRDLPVV